MREEWLLLPRSIRTKHVRNLPTVTLTADFKVEIETSENYAIGESQRSNEYRLPPGAAILVILGCPSFHGG
jgi:hypothetical protein